jgi:hypothetical protein
MALRRLTPAPVLVVLAPLIGEVLLGSTPLSRWYLLPSLMCFYGSGALLIRELVFRRGFRWARIIALGFVYALIEEGLTDQSLFNPHWPSAGAFLVYGRWLGVNWYWAEYLLGWHAIWSISLPILLTDLLFPARRTVSWLRPGGLRVVGFIYGASCVSTLVLYWFLSGGFIAPPLALLCTALLVLALCGLALWGSPGAERQASGESPRQAFGLCWVLGGIAFLGGLFWLGNHDYLVPRVPPVPLILGQLALALAVTWLVWLLSRWAASRSQWADQQRLALASGVLLAGGLAGIKIVQDGVLLDLLAQLVLVGLVVILLALFNWRLSVRVPASKAA